MCRPCKVQFRKLSKPIRALKSGTRSLMGILYQWMPMHISDWKKIWPVGPNYVSMTKNYKMPRRYTFNAIMHSECACWYTFMALCFLRYDENRRYADQGSLLSMSYFFCLTFCIAMVHCAGLETRLVDEALHSGSCSLH
jgi:hypothetical protein